MHVAIAQLEKDFIVWTSVVGAVILAVKSVRGQQRKSSRTYRSKEEATEPNRAQFPNAKPLIWDSYEG